MKWCRGRILRWFQGGDQPAVEGVEGGLSPHREERMHPMRIFYLTFCVRQNKIERKRFLLLKEDVPSIRRGIKMEIGYLGPRGTFSQHVAQEYAKALNASLKTYENISALIWGVYQKQILQAVVPIENSIEGSVNVTLDMLAWDVKLKIIKEISAPITHNLLVKNKESHITHVLSHPQAIAQCRGFLDTHFPNVSIQYTCSTAEAAQKVMIQQTNPKEQWAAIGAAKAAQEYGLTILRSSIQDHRNNITRFVVLSKQEMDKKEDAYKTSIIFSTENKPGSLYRILQILDLWNINMTRIESRPAKNQLGKYIFFVDFDGHWQDADVNDALTMIKRKTSFFHMLGSYNSLVL